MAWCSVPSTDKNTCTKAPSVYTEKDQWKGTSHKKFMTCAYIQKTGPEVV